MPSVYELQIKAVDQTSAPLRKIETALKRLDRTAKRTGNTMEGVGGAKVAAGIGGVAGAVSRLSGPLLAAGAAAATLGIGLKSVIDASKELQNIENGLRLIAGSTEELNGTMALLRDLAVQNRTAFAATADLYTKLSISTAELGMSQQDVIALTTRLSQALAVAGADAVTTSSVIRQFGQAMASGTVRGDEFNSIVEGLGPALAIMAKESGITVGELRNMSQEGELTASAFAEILLNSNALEESFGKLSATTDQLETALSDATNRLLTEFGKATGITDGYNNVLEGTTNMFNQMSTVLSTLNTPLEEFTGQMQALIDGGNTASAIDLIKKRMAALSAPLFGDQLEDERKTLVALLVEAKLLEGQMDKTAKKTKEIPKILTDMELAMAGIAGYKDIVNRALGTDAEFELATPLEQLKIKLNDTQTALRAYRADSDLLSKSTKEGGLGLLQYTKIVQGLGAQITILEKAIEDEELALRRANDPLFDLTMQYDELMKRYSAVTHAQYVLLEAMEGTNGGTREQKALMAQLNEEMAQLRTQLGMDETNFGQIIANTAIEDLAKYEKQLAEVNERLETYSGLEAGITTSLTADQLKVITAQLAKEKKGLVERISVLNGNEKAQKKTNERLFTYANYLEDIVKDANRSAKESVFLQRVTADLDAQLKAGTISLDAYAEAMKIVKSRIGEVVEETITYDDIFDAFVVGQEEGFKKISQYIEQNADDFSSSLARNLVTSKNLLSDFQSFFNFVLDEIAIAIVKKNITKPLIDGLIGITGSGGLFGTPTVGAPFGGFTLPGRANGGPVSSQKGYIVGERGPELFMPRTSGTIVPNDELGQTANSGDTTINFNLNAVSTQDGIEFLLKNKPQIISMVTQAQNQRGRQGITS